MKQSIILFAAALAFAACSQDSEDRSQDSNIIQLSAAISGGDDVKAGTRAYDATEANYQNTQFLSDKGIFVEAYDHGTGAAYANSTSTYTTTSTAGTETGSIQLSGTIYYPASGNNVDILAFYPSSVSSSDDTFPESGDISDQTTIAAYQGFDLMYADKLSNKAKDTRHGLTFHHALAQIKVVLTPGNGVTAEEVASKVTAVTIKNTVPVATISTNTSTGIITAEPKDGTDVKDIEILGNKATNIGLIVPQNVAKDKAFVSIAYTGSVNGRLTYSIPEVDGKTFAAGKTYTYTFAVNAATIELQSLVITNWDPQTGGSGDFTI